MKTPLCELAFKYGTDKCPEIKHNYTPYYWELLKDKPIKKVLELGIGGDVYANHLLKQGIVNKRGASLRMWRDFFPNAQVYGVDIVPNTMFEDERIRTFLLHERNASGWKNLIEEIGSDIDFFIDDGRHRRVDQIFVARTLLPLFKKDVIYIVEDVTEPEVFVSFIPEYKCEIIKLEPGGRRDGLVRIYNETISNNTLV